MTRLLLINLSCGLSLLLAQAVPGQPVGADSGMDSGAVDGVPETKPEVYYLEDADGNLVPVPGISYELFIELYKRRNDEMALDRDPEFVIQDAKIQGRVEDTVARFALRARIKLLRDSRVRIPLRFPHGIVTDADSLPQTEDLFITYDKEVGYLAWLQGEKDQTKTVSLDLSVPIESIGDESRLVLAIPRAVANELTLDVADRQLDASVSNPLENILQVLPHGKGTRLAVSGRGGNLKLSWKNKSQVSIERPVVLKAEVDEVVRVMGPQQYACDFVISVRSYRGAFDSFHLRLPPGTAMLPVSNSELEISELEPEKEGDSSTRLYLIQRRTGKSSAPLELRVTAELVRANREPSQWYEVGGVEVLEAVEQWGQVTAEVGGDWTVQWKHGLDVKRVALGNDQSRFEYYQKPLSLQMHTTPKPTQVLIVPRRRVEIAAGHAELNGTFEYEVRGNSAVVVTLELGDWQLESFEPLTLLRADWQEELKNGTLEVTLPPGSSSAFTLQARLPILDDADRIALTRMRIAGANVQPGSLTVVPRDNIALTPLEKDIQGLFAVASSSDAGGATTTRELAYRDRAGAPEAVFVGTFEVRPRAVAVSCVNDVQIADEQMQVEQRFDYVVSYEAIDELQLQVPQEVMASGTLQVFQKGDSLVPLVIAANQEPAADTVAVNLQQSHVGLISLVVQFTRPISKDMTSFALVMPDKVQVNQVVSNVTTITSANGIHVSPVQAGWRVLPAADSGNAASSSTLTSGELLNQVAIDVVAEANQEPETTTIQKAWIQSWIGERERQDRIVYNLNTRSEKLVFQIPALASVANAAVDGRLTPAAPAADGTVQLPIATDTAAAGEHVVELWLQYGEAASSNGERKLQIPEMKNAGRPRFVYWQVALPRNEHLLLTPTGFTSEQQWSWKQWFWGQSARLNQQQLEAWSGASTQTDLPARTNQYLYSSFGATPEMTISPTRQTYLFFGLSLTAFVVGLLTLEFGWLTKPTFYLAIGVLLVVASCFYADLILMLTQLGAFGVVLAVIAHLLRQWALATEAAPATPVSGSFEGTDSKTVQGRLLSLDQSSQVSTAAGQLGIPLSVTEPKT